MAQEPALDLNDQEHLKLGDLKNYAVSGLWEPGSTFKVVTAIAGIEQGKVLLDDIYNCEKGNFKVADRTIHDHEKYGMLTFQQVMEFSSNIGIAKLGAKIGKDSLYEYIRAFGFGAYTGIKLAGETTGICRPPNAWSGVSLSMISFGQEISVSPLQLTAAYSAIADDGILREPLIIKEIHDRDGNSIFSAKPAVVRRVYSSSTAVAIKALLQGVVERGTGILAQVPGYTVCGKTGTAQKIDEKTRVYAKEKYFSSFCGFVPAQQPAVTIAVFLDEPRGAYYGGLIACPIFSRIASRVMAYLNVPPDNRLTPPVPKKNKKILAYAHNKHFD
jgi:cell division protein FtsI (penicillin-binding protein 3)